MLAQHAHSFKPHAPARAQATPIYCNGKAIGRVEGQTFRKTVHSSRGHLLHTPPAIAFDVSTLRAAAAAGATRAEVFDADTGRTFTATLETIEAHKFPVPRGHGNQVGLHLDRWSINGETPAAERRAAETNAERKALQGSLFGEGDE